MMADTICSKDTSNKQGIVFFFEKEIGNRTYDIASITWQRIFHK